MNIQFLRTHRLQAVRQFLILAAGFLIAAPGWSAGWDAKIRLVNTVMHVPDVKAVLAENVSAKFEEKFPATQYGIYVLIDKSNPKAPTRGVVYMMLGLSKRNADGSYLLPEFLSSMMLPLGNDDDPDIEYRLITERLAEMTKAFSNLTVQNADRFR